MNPDLLNILVCPATHQPVTLAPAVLVESLNRKIAAGALRSAAGQVIQEPIDGALVREDGVVAYPIRQGIPIMLVEEGVRLDV